MPRSRRKRLLRGLDLGHGAPSSGDPAVLDFVSTVYLVGVVDHELFVSVSTLLAITQHAVELGEEHRILKRLRIGIHLVVVVHSSPYDTAEKDL